MSFSLCPLKICSIFIVKNGLKIVKVSTHKFEEGKEINIRCTERTTLRIDDNLKTRIQLLAIKNNFSMNKMFIYLLELGYRSYIERFEKNYDDNGRFIYEYYIYENPDDTKANLD